MHANALTTESTLHWSKGTHTGKVRRTGSVPQQKALALCQAIVARLHPRVRLLLPATDPQRIPTLCPPPHLPLDTECILHLYLIVPMSRTVSIARVGLERAELLAAPRDRLHLREVEREEVLVERVDRAPVRAPGHGRRDELRCDFLHEMCMSNI